MGVSTQSTWGLTPAPPTTMAVSQILVALCVVGSAVAAPQLGRSRSVVSSVGANVNENQVVTSVITSLTPSIFQLKVWFQRWLQDFLYHQLELQPQPERPDRPDPCRSHPADQLCGRRGSCLKQL